MKEKNKRMFKKILKGLGRYTVIVAGSVIAAFSIDVFLVPYRIAPGGVSGLSTVIYYLSNQVIPVGTLMLILNIPLFIIGFKSIGLRFITRTVVATVVMSLATDLLAFPATHYISPLLSPNGTQDMLLYAIYGGVIMGVGLGMVLKLETTTGGSDLLAAVLHKKFPHITLGNFLLSIDGLIVITAMISFHSIIIGLYSIIALFISSKVIDLIIEGLNYSKAVYIFSLKYNEIAERLCTERRGVTLLHAYGVYNRQDRDVVLCVVFRTYIQHVKNVVKEIDPTAFILILDAKDVLGEGFKELN